MLQEPTAHHLATVLGAAALAVTIDYVRERNAFGRPLGALQNIRMTLAELSTEIDIARGVRYGRFRRRRTPASSDSTSSRRASFASSR